MQDRQEGEGQWNGCGETLTQCMAAQTSKSVAAQAPQASKGAGSAEGVCRGEGRATKGQESARLPPCPRLKGWPRNTLVWTGATYIDLRGCETSFPPIHIPLAVKCVEDATQVSRSPTC